MSNTGNRNPSNKSLTMMTGLLALILMPVGAALDGPAQWVLIGASTAFIFICVYQMNANRRASKG
ncbi:hypothetical protein AB0M39_14815 [Streptomyces sp. NPDC051907]|uniref:hypothetical protein n=1 Tax=Streptomyces sp. NPDC051907 TaxID=3155284 RepID=UPI0034153174